MTNNMPQSRPQTIATPGSDGGGSGTQGQLARQQQRQQRKRLSDDHQPPVVCMMSRLQLQEEVELGHDDEYIMSSSSRRILQWQQQQEHCPEFAAQCIAPAQRESSQYDVANSIRRSSFHYNLHSKLHGLFQDDAVYFTSHPTNKLPEQRL
jgi:hypothetical protein